MLADAFADCGFDADTFAVVPDDRVAAPAFDVEFPDTAGYDAVVTLGARWPVYDDALVATWVGTQMRLLRDTDVAGIPVLGVCFGGQLLAQAHGGRVTRSSTPEIGWYAVDSDDPDTVPAGPWFQWHFDRWSLPPGATELARNGQSSQAFRIGRSLALQFHPELDRPLLEQWIDDDKDGAEAAEVGVRHDELRSRTDELQDDAAARLRRLVRVFVGRGQPRPS